jgi:hypothetical protein
MESFKNNGLFVYLSQSSTIGDAGLLTHSYAMPKIKGIESKTFYFNAIQDWNLLSDLIKSITDLQNSKQNTKAKIRKLTQVLRKCNNLKSFGFPII